jgi:glycosyltransferase involved in cell wall biosynthesis
MSATSDNGSSVAPARYTFTVFTPTYNRAHLLPRVYESLKQQTFRDFEWLIIDDGSTDNTREVVHAWQPIAPFPIRYIAQPNGGKHTAVNRGAREAQGNLLAILDSDDWYLPQALDRFLHHWNSIPEPARAGFAGVTGLCAYESRELIGSRFPQDVFDSDPIDLRYRHNVQGEKSGVVRTEVLRQFPYPEDVGKYISESVVWNRIARNYKTRFINEVLTVKEFQPGGITRDGRLLQVRNSKASLFTCQELLAIADRLPLKMKVKTYSNYVRHSLHQGIRFPRQFAEVPSKAFFCCCYAVGAYLKIQDTRLLAREQKRSLRPEPLPLRRNA